MQSERNNALIDWFSHHPPCFIYGAVQVRFTGSGDCRESGSSHNVHCGGMDRHLGLTSVHFAPPPIFLKDRGFPLFADSAFPVLFGTVFAIFAVLAGMARIRTCASRRVGCNRQISCQNESESKGKDCGPGGPEHYFSPIRASRYFLPCAAFSS